MAIEALSKLPDITFIKPGGTPGQDDRDLILGILVDLRYGCFDHPNIRSSSVFDVDNKRRKGWMAAAVLVLEDPLLTPLTKRSPRFRASVQSHHRIYTSDHYKSLETQSGDIEWTDRLLEKAIVYLQSDLVNSNSVQAPTSRKN